MHLVLKNSKQIMRYWKGEVFAEFLEVKIAENYKCKHYLCRMRIKTPVRRRRKLQDYSSYFSSKAGVTDS